MGLNGGIGAAKMEVVEDKKYFVERFSGSRKKIGRALGRFYAEHGLAWFRPCSDPSKISKDQIDYALPQLGLVERFDPGLAEELHGLAEGLGISFERAAAVVLTSGMTKPNSGPGCTAFVIRSNSGDIYLSRNLDFTPSDERVHLARFTHPPDALATFGGTEALLGSTEGINERGVAIAMAIVAMEEYDWQTALPKKPPKEGLLFSIAIRIALETCESARSAAEFLSSIPHLETFNFLVADPSGEVFVVEAAPRGCEVRRGTSGEKMIITNIFSAPFAEQRARWADEMQARAQKTLSGLRERALKRAWELAESFPGGLDEEAILALLRMVAFDYAEGDVTHTVWSVCFNMTRGAILWCPGTPRAHGFEHLGRITDRRCVGKPGSSPMEIRKLDRQDYRAAIRALVEFCERSRHKSDIVAVYLGGSVARGDFSPARSDIDVYIVTGGKEEKEEIEREFKEAARKIARKRLKALFEVHQEPVGIAVTTISGIQSGKSFLAAGFEYHNFVNTGKLIWGREIKPLIPKPSREEERASAKQALQGVCALLTGQRLSADVQGRERLTYLLFSTIFRAACIALCGEGRYVSGKSEAVSAFREAYPQKLELHAALSQSFALWREWERRSLTDAELQRLKTLASSFVSGICELWGAAGQGD